MTVKGLKRGRCKDKEGKPVLPVPQKHIEAVLPELTPPVRAMVRLQLLTGMRPREVLKMKAGDIETTGEVWTYRPESHKNAWRGKQRNILIGPRGQDILLSFLVGRAKEDFLLILTMAASSSSSLPIARTQSHTSGVLKMARTSRTQSTDTSAAFRRHASA